MSEIILHNLMYSKSDLDKVPPKERVFFLMASGVANDTQMLNKVLAVILKEDDSGFRLINQGNSAFALLILRMLAGRLYEAWKLVSKYSKTIKANYEIELSDDARDAFKRVLNYFGNKKSLILAVRDGVAFHHFPEHVASAYASLDPETDIGDYLHSKIGNTLFYTIEILQYETLKNLSHMNDHREALRQLIRDVQEQTENFNSLIFGFTLVFAKRYLPHSLERLQYEHETIPVPSFAESSLPFFSLLPSVDP